MMSYIGLVVVFTVLFQINMNSASVSVDSDYPLYYSTSSGMNYSHLWHVDLFISTEIVTEISETVGKLNPVFLNALESVLVPNSSNTDLVNDAMRLVHHPYITGLPFMNDLKKIKLNIKNVDFFLKNVDMPESNIIECLKAIHTNILPQLPTKFHIDLQNILLSMKKSQRMTGICESYHSLKDKYYTVYLHILKLDIEGLALFIHRYSVLPMEPYDIRKWNEYSADFLNKGKLTIAAAKNLTKNVSGLLKRCEMTIEPRRTTKGLTKLATIYAGNWMKLGKAPIKDHF